MTRAQLERLSTVLLVLGTFFNPLGFDALWALVQHLTDSYAKTSVLFYSASALCFGLHYWLKSRPVSKSQEDYPSNERSTDK